jgi:GTP-binding protein Era
MENPQPVNHRSGFAAVVGRPSVGKSTLVNTLLRQKIASVSPRPQTTRRRQLGIYTSDSAQLILMDTPGIHQPVHKLGEYLNQVALDTLQDADVILWLVDASDGPHSEDELVAEYLKNTPSLPPVLLILNKTDLLKENQLEKRIRQYGELIPSIEMVPISALKGSDTQALLEKVCTFLPPGAAYYDPDQVTDLYEREIATDLIRESVLRNLKDEVPHAVAVRLDDYNDEGDTFARIYATLFVERESQKGIVIGQKGQMIKQIGTLARKEIENLTERKVYLELKVKVQKNWRNDPNALRQFGYITENKE